MQIFTNKFSIFSKDVLIIVYLFKIISNKKSN